MVHSELLPHSSISSFRIYLNLAVYQVWPPRYLGNLSLNFWFRCYRVSCCSCEVWRQCQGLNFFIIVVSYFPLFLYQQVFWIVFQQFDRIPLHCWFFLLLNIKNCTCLSLLAFARFNQLRNKTWVSPHLLSIFSGAFNRVWPSLFSSAYIFSFSLRWCDRYFSCLVIKYLTESWLRRN